LDSLLCSDHAGEIDHHLVVRDRHIGQSGEVGR
jgi:hypothetical protein